MGAVYEAAEAAQFYTCQGRSTQQKAELLRSIIERPNPLFSRMPFINVSEFEKATYSNRALIHPLNQAQDRHFSPNGEQPN